MQVETLSALSAHYRQVETYHFAFCRALHRLGHDPSTEWPDFNIDTVHAEFERFLEHWWNKFYFEQWLLLNMLMFGQISSTTWHLWLAWLVFVVVATLRKSQPSKCHTCWCVCWPSPHYNIFQFLSIVSFHYPSPQVPLPCFSSGSHHPDATGSLYFQYSIFNIHIDTNSEIKIAR